MWGDSSVVDKGASREGRRLVLVRPAGFCGGVKRATELFRRLREQMDPQEPLFVLHEVVHNSTVTEKMLCRGAIFVDSPVEIPDGAQLLLGAHGTPLETLAQCRKRDVTCHDATCPRVAALQDEILALPPGLPVVLLGDGRHPEVRGLMSRMGDRACHLLGDPEEARELSWLPEAALFCQTTRDEKELDELRRLLAKRVGRLEDHAAVCESVALRQRIFARVARNCDRVYVLGSFHSANARRLLEVGRRNCSGEAYLVENAEELSEEEFDFARTVGLVTATSTPDDVIEFTLEKFQRMGFQLEETTCEEWEGEK